MAESRLSSEANWCITQSEIIPITFKWTIKNFSYHLKKIGYKLKSSTFSCEDRDKSKWYLQIYPKGDTAENENNISLFLMFEPDSKREANVIFQFSLLNSKSEKKFVGQKSMQKFNINSDSWGWSKFIAVDKLLDESSVLVEDDTLTIYCEINLSTESTNTSGKTPDKELPDCRLGHDFGKLFENELFSDVILTACGKQFKVHKNILAARSPVFAAMFSTEMKEKNEDVIEIGDISDDALRYLLHFIYSGKTPEETSVKSVKLISDLLAAADKYDLERLKVMCEKILAPQLAVENAIDLLILADLHNAEELKEMAMDFVNTNVVALRKADNWISLVQNHPSLLDEIFSYHLQKGLKIKDA